MASGVRDFLTSFVIFYNCFLFIFLRLKEFLDVIIEVNYVGVGCWIIMGWSSVAKRGAVAFLLKPFYSRQRFTESASPAKKKKKNYSIARLREALGKVTIY